MNTKARRVLKGWLELTQQERQWVAQRINQTNTDYAENSLRKSLDESLSVTFGPLKEGCPCCGRS